MSGIGERDDAPDVEDLNTDEIEQEGADGSGADEGGADEGDGDAGDGAVDQGTKDAPGDHEGQAGQAAEVTGRPRSSATIAVQEAKRAAKEAKAEAEALKRQVEELTRSVTGTKTAEQERLEQERVALMTPDEKVEYLLKKQEQGFNARFNQMQHQQFDATDRASFRAAASEQTARGKALASVADEVETLRAQLAAQGNSGFQREMLAAYLIGQRALANAGKAVKKQAQQGQQNVQRQQGKPANGRGDTGSANQRGSGNDAQGRRTRLENLEI